MSKQGRLESDCDINSVTIIRKHAPPVRTLKSSSVIFLKYNYFNYFCRILALQGVMELKLKQIKNTALQEINNTKVI